MTTVNDFISLAEACLPREAFSPRVLYSWELSDARVIRARQFHFVFVSSGPATRRGHYVGLWRLNESELFYVDSYGLPPWWITDNNVTLHYDTVCIQPATSSLCAAYVLMCARACLVGNYARVKRAFARMNDGDRELGVLSYIARARAVNCSTTRRRRRESSS